MSTSSPASSPRVSGPSRRRRGVALRGLLCGLSAAIALGGPGVQAWAQSPVAGGSTVRLPALGDAGTEDLSLADERRLGEQIMREARRDPDLLDDAVLLEYLQSLWQPLVKAAHGRGDIDAELLRQFPWEVFLVRDRSVNAFALPGGYVGVHLGLIAITTNRDQLASVLAHEMSHVSQRHIARSIGNSRNTSLLAVASVLLAVLAATRSNNVDAANATLMGGQGLALQGQLNFSREMEREADRVGFGVLTAAGFAAGGMAQMFERLQGNSAVADSGAFPYLRTHPLTVDRISEARSRVLLSPNATPVPALMHALMQGRARVLMDKNPQALQRFVSGETSSPLLADRVAALYMAALAHAQLGEGVRAEDFVAQAQRLAATAPVRERDADLALALMQVQARLAANDGPGTIRLLDALPSEGWQRPVLLARAQAAVLWHQRDAGAASAEMRRNTEALQTWVSEHAQDVRAWELLSSTAEAIGQPLRSRRAAAEARVALGDLGGAIDRLRAAQATARGATGGEFIEASIIDARLRALMLERRQMALEARQRGGGQDRGEGPPQ